MKKIILPLIVVSLMVLSGLNAVAQNQEEKQKQEINKIFTQPTITQEKNNLIQLDFEETNTYLMKENKPLLP